MKTVLLLAVASVLTVAACGEDAPDATSETAASAADSATTETSGGSSVPSTGAATTSGPAATTPPDPATELAGHTYVSTDVQGFTLVDGTEITLVFEGANVSANAGCNQQAGTWTIEGDVLVVPPMVSTMMACEPAALMDQDTWLSAVLTSRPTIALDGDTMTLTAPGATVTFVDDSVANPDLPLEGTAWTVDTLISNDAASSLPAGAIAPTVTFDAGTVAVDTGCNTGSGAYTLSGDSITFDPIFTTRRACLDPNTSAMEQLVLTVLSGTATAEIDGSTLTLTNGTNGLRATG